MHHETNKAGFIIGCLIIIPLTIFTSWRDLDLMQQVLPASQGLAALFGLAALDGGFLLWCLGFHKAKSNDQRLAAGVLAGACFLGVGLGCALDLYLAITNKGFVDTNRSNLYIGVIILIVVATMIDMGGGAWYMLTDPKKKQEMRDQKAHDKIDDIANSHIEKNAAMYAPQFAQVKVAQWLHQAAMEHGVNGHVALPGMPQPSLPSGPVVDSTAMQMPTGQLPVIHPPTQPQQQNGGLIGAIKQAFVGNQQPQAQQHLCAAHRAPAIFHHEGLWYCQECLATLMQSQTNVPTSAPTHPLAGTVSMQQEGSVPNQGNGNGTNHA